MSNIEAIEILKKDMDRIITLNNGGNIEKEFDLYQAEALAIQALENTKQVVVMAQWNENTVPKCDVRNCSDEVLITVQHIGYLGNFIEE